MSDFIPFRALIADDVLANGRLSADLERRGSPIGQFDTLIASHALTLGVVLVTNNARHFSLVAELRIEDWL